MEIVDYLLYKLESDNLELKKLRDNCLSNYTDSLLADKVRILVLNTVTLIFLKRIRG